MTYQIFITPVALQMLTNIAVRRIRESIRDRVDDLSVEPEKKGKPLTGDLAGYRSLRVIGQRYRIVYRVEKEVVTVLVVALGIRKSGNKHDIYSLAKKLLRLGLLEPPLP